MSEDHEAYRLVAAGLGVDARADGGYMDAPCPRCGKFTKGTTHFHFSATLGRCFACGYKGGIGWIAHDLGLGKDEHFDPPVPRATPPRPPAVWQHNPEAWVAEFCRHPERVALWRAYKPVTVDQIAKYQLGVGVLPTGTSRCRHPRLILPIRRGGAVTGFRARRIAGACTVEDCDPSGKYLVKDWVAAAGSSKALFNADRIAEAARARLRGEKRLRPLWISISENPIDALLLENHLGSALPIDMIGAAVLSVSMWDEEWADLIAAADPNLQLTWLDNDAQGQAIGATRERLLASYRRSHNGQPPPVVGAGMAITNGLLARGVNSRLVRWPDVELVPPKADPAWALAQIGVPHGRA